MKSLKGMFLGFATPMIIGIFVAIVNHGNVDMKGAMWCSVVFGIVGLIGGEYIFPKDK